MEASLTNQHPNIEFKRIDNSKNHLYFFLGLILIIVTVISISVISYFFFFNKKQPDSVIVRAGQENIYQKDLDYEVSQLPPQGIVDRNSLLQKMTTDSIILQGGAEAGYINLDTNIFNSPQKDYAKRIEAVQSVKKSVKERVTHINGTAITIFFQNGVIGPLGYAKSKSVAWAKISGLHKNLLDKKLTKEQVIEEIKTDKSLETIDPAYSSNAYFNFDVEEGDQITRIHELDNILWQLPEGGISDVFTDTGRLATLNKEKEDNKESYFIFGIVEKVTRNEDFANYDNWLAEQKKKYETIYY